MCGACIIAVFPANETIVVVGRACNGVLFGGRVDKDGKRVGDCVHGAVGGKTVGRGGIDAEPPLPKVSLVITADTSADFDARVSTLIDFDLLVLAINAHFVKWRGPIVQRSASLLGEDAKSNRAL